MTLNEEEKRFILHWSIDYRNAYQAAKSYCKISHIVTSVKKTLEETIADLERIYDAHSHYKFWYGLLFGLLHITSYNVRNTIYAACSHALENITNAAYYPSEKVSLK